MDEWIKKLPSGACCYALAMQSHPVAFKDTTGKYIGANNAFENLVGYARSELFRMRWQDITLQEDVYGEQLSFDAILTGKTRSYMSTKRYRHKMGHYVNAINVVRWFPEEVEKDKIGCFVVDISPELCTLADLRDTRDHARKEIDEIKATLATLMESRDRNDINISTNTGNNSNSEKAIIALGFIVLGISIALIWIAYYVFGTDKMAPPPDPRPSTNATASIEGTSP